jgi:hypothetical protein
MIKHIKVQVIPAKLYQLLIIGLIVLVAISSCSIGKPEHETEITHTSGYYSFDPESIFQSLSQSDESIFRQIGSITNPVDTIPSTSDVTWSQEEFSDVMQSFHKFLWKEPAGNNWTMVSVEFRTGCNDVNNSLQFGSYHLYRVDSSSGRTTRQTRRIVIKPSEGTVWWSESELYPVIEQWIPVDLENLKISATDAVSIAEANGGEATRVDVGNECVKIISGYHDEWRVAYYSLTSNNTILEFFINNNTGEYREENPK